MAVVSLLITKEYIRRQRTKNIGSRGLRLIERIYVSLVRFAYVAAKRIIKRK